jgi:hypothetical protein
VVPGLVRGGLVPLVSPDSCVACSTEGCTLIVEIRRDRGGTGGTLGEKLGLLTRGAWSERPRERRQSGVMDVDGSLRPEVH